MAAPLEAADLADVLKELRDSIREQNTLLKTFIAQHGDPSNLGEETRPSPSKSPSADGSTHTSPEGKESPAPGPVITASDRGSRQSNHSRSHDAELESNHDANQNAETELRDFAARYGPLLKDRVEFYLASGPVPEELGGRGWCGINDPSLVKGITTWEPQPQKPNPTNSWKFWIPVFAKQDMDGRVSQDEHGPLPRNRGGRPDYVPPWELRKFGNQIFHIDDIDKKHPLEFSEDDMDGPIEIPYSFTPPVRFGRTGSAEYGSFNYDDPLIATTGITVEWGLLHECLGSLYSVPPDGRIPLRFERNEIRLMCASKGISDYLRGVRQTFTRLYQGGGSFAIRDFAMNKPCSCHYPDVGAYAPSFFFENTRACSYSWKEEMNPEWIEEPSYWKAAAPALQNEKRGLVVSPVWESVYKRLYEREMCYRAKFPGQDPTDYMNSEDVVVSLPDGNQSRKWYRLIHCQGLASIMGHASRGSNPSADAEQIWNLILYSSPERPRLAHHRESVLRETLDAHIFCSRTQRAGNHYLSRWKPFHITWFATLDGAGEDALKQSSWKYGPLYGSKENHYIRETAFTLAILPHHDGPYFDHEGPNFSAPFEDEEQVKLEGFDFWTILLLSPPRTDDLVSSMEHPAVYILVVIREGLQQAANAWEVMRDHFRMILDDQNTMMDPRKHDELLFDDDSFSRSRLYFWAVDSLEIFIAQIEDAINQWEDFWAAREKMIVTFYKVTYHRMFDTEIGSEVDWQEFKSHVRQVEDQINRLKDYQAQFKGFQAKTLALREGLFNASSVIESRAATRLGENVKLLTYVSIFYLPLAFCAGLFSMNETYDTSAFAITSVLVAVGTYVLVANLGHTVSTLQSFYRLFKQPIAERMAQDPEQKWAEKGEGFTSFQPDRKAVKPSEWYLLLYWILEILRKIGMMQDPGKRSKEPHRVQVESAAAETVTDKTPHEQPSHSPKPAQSVRSTESHKQEVVASHGLSDDVNPGETAALPMNHTNNFRRIFRMGSHGRTEERDVER